MWQGDQRRAEVEDEPVALEHGELAADDVIALHDGHVVTCDLEADGGGEATDAAADHDGSGHAALLVSCVAAAAAKGSMPRPPTTATSGSRK